MRGCTAGIIIVEQINGERVEKIDKKGEIENFEMEHERMRMRERKKVYIFFKLG